MVKAEILLPLLGIAGGFFIAILAIFTDHRQKMQMIAKGMFPEEQLNYNKGLSSGLLLTFLGITLLLIFKNYGSVYGLPWYTPGVFLFSIGLAQLLNYFLCRKNLRGNFLKDQIKIRGS